MHINLEVQVKEDLFYLDQDIFLIFSQIGCIILNLFFKILLICARLIKVQNEDW